MPTVNRQPSTGKMNFIKQIFLIAFLFALATNSFSQLPADMRNIKASQISDQQLQQIAQQFQSSGMSEAELMQQLQSRGLSESEIIALVLLRKKNCHFSVCDRSGEAVSRVLSFGFSVVG